MNKADKKISNFRRKSKKAYSMLLDVVLQNPDIQEFALEKDEIIKHIYSTKLGLTSINGDKLTIKSQKIANELLARAVIEKELISLNHEEKAFYCKLSETTNKFYSPYKRIDNELWYILLNDEYKINLCDVLSSCLLNEQNACLLYTTLVPYLSLLKLELNSFLHLSRVIYSLKEKININHLSEHLPKIVSKNYKFGEVLFNQFIKDPNLNEFTSPILFGLLTTKPDIWFKKSLSLIKTESNKLRISVLSALGTYLYESGNSNKIKSTLTNITKLWENDELIPSLKELYLKIIPYHSSALKYFENQWNQDDKEIADFYLKAVLIHSHSVNQEWYKRIMLKLTESKVLELSKYNMLDSKLYSLLDSNSRIVVQFLTAWVQNQSSISSAKKSITETFSMTLSKFGKTKEQLSELVTKWLFQENFSFHQEVSNVLADISSGNEQFELELVEKSLSKWNLIDHLFVMYKILGYIEPKTVYPRLTLSLLASLLPSCERLKKLQPKLKWCFVEYLGFNFGGPVIKYAKEKSKISINEREREFWVNVEKEVRHKWEEFASLPALQEFTPGSNIVRLSEIANQKKYEKIEDESPKESFFDLIPKKVIMGGRETILINDEGKIIRTEMKSFSMSYPSRRDLTCSIADTDYQTSIWRGIKRENIVCN